MRAEAIQLESPRRERLSTQACPQSICEKAEAPENTSTKGGRAEMSERKKERERESY